MEICGFTWILASRCGKERCHFDISLKVGGGGGGEDGVFTLILALKVWRCGVSL